LLLGAVLARFAADLDKDTRKEMQVLMTEVESGQKIGQPRLRHRLQEDRVGLSRSRHRLMRGPNGLFFEMETDKGAPTQSALAAVYACASIPDDQRPGVVDVLRRGMDWVGPTGPGLINHLVGPEIAMRFRSGALNVASDPLLWALDILGLESDDKPEAKQVQKRYRALVRDAHPDHGAQDDGAADRIAELSRAREILLS
jgi:hypothetical protein